MLQRSASSLFVAMLVTACTATTPSKDPGADAQAIGSVHDIDVGTLAQGAPVTLVGLVITGVAISAGVEKTGSMKCRYRAFAQDPVGPAPSGIMLHAFGMFCQGGNCTCPDIPNSGTPLDAVVTLGDVYSVNGTASVVTPTDDAGASLITEHAVVVKGITKTGANGIIKPQVFQDPFQAAKGSPSYKDFESMVVTIQPPAPFGVGTPTAFGTFSGSGAFFSGIYGPNFEMGGKYPAPNQKFVSITGIATPLLNGEVAPRQASDFVSP